MVEIAKADGSIQIDGCRMLCLHRGVSYILFCDRVAHSKERKRGKILLISCRSRAAEGRLPQNHAIVLDGDVSRSKCEDLPPFESDEEKRITHLPPPKSLIS